MTVATATRPRTQTEYSTLSKRIKEQNLLTKTPQFYIKRTIQLGFLTLAAWSAVLIADGAWWSIALAPVLGILAAQFGFLAHEAAHSQIFNSAKANKWFSLIVANLVVGLSYGWWDRKKHNLHHANPNTAGKDPDLYMPVIKYTPEDYNATKNPEKLLTRYQGTLFPFLILFTGFDLLRGSFITLFKKDSNIPNRKLELVLLVTHYVAPLVGLYLLGGWVYTLAFAAAQMVTFGAFMGGAFAPNHIGMPVIPKDAKVDYFRRQVLTSRDIKSGWFMDNLMGGLNYQIEHHLFPSMPRPNLAKARMIVKEFCREHAVEYTETTLVQAFQAVIGHLNKVGLKNADPLVCPLVQQFRQVAPSA